MTLPGPASRSKRDRRTRRPDVVVGHHHRIDQTPRLPLTDRLDHPLDVILRSGGDHRQALDPVTGLSAYRVAGQPRDGVPLGSCTASWPSELAWSVASEHLARWQATDGGLAGAMDEQAADIRRRLRDVFDLRGEATVALTPSGTDAVFVVSALVLSWGAEHVHHVVVGAAELGSGTLGAAQGDAFTQHRPVGSKQPFGAEIDGLGDRCTAQPVYLRDPDGIPLPLGLIDEAVTEEVDAAVAEGSTAVVHMVAHSKLTSADLPRSWTGARSGLTTPTNPGLLLRWEMALAEIAAYHALAPDRRSRVYHAFAASLIGTFDPAPTVGLGLPMPPVHELASGLGAFPSVFSLSIDDARGAPLDKQRLAALHADLDTPLDGEAPWLRTRYHLGQPVALGQPDEARRSVLRVALGARLVRELAATPDSGTTWFREQVDGLRRKIEHLTT